MIHNWITVPPVQSGFCRWCTKVISSPFQNNQRCKQQHLWGEQLVSYYHLLWTGTRCSSSFQITLHLTSSLPSSLERAAWLTCDKQVTEISLTMLPYQPCYVNLLLQTTRVLMSAKCHQSACPSALCTLEVTSRSAPYFQSRLCIRVLSRMDNTAVEVRRAAFAVPAQAFNT